MGIKFINTNVVPVCKAVCLEGAVFVACGNAPQQLQKYFLSLGSRPETVLSLLYCLCAGGCVFFCSRWCGVRFESFYIEYVFHEMKQNLLSYCSPVWLIHK